MGTANYDVVVVGAGAAGLSAAIGLAKADFSVLVVEGAAFPGAENWSGCVYFAESLADPELLGPDGVEALAWERRLVERGMFSSNGHAFAGVTYRDPAAFRHCYTVLRPIFDHHLAQVARQAGATILPDTTVEGLIRERGRVIGVSTNRGPIYADLVFLAEGDASHLVTKEGFERDAPGRQDAHFLQGVKQVIEMPPGAIDEIFGVGPDEGAAYEMLLRNGTLRGRETTLNMGGFLYTNRESISLGFVLPLNHLNEGFGGDPNLLMEWLRGLPEIERWTRGGTPGVFGAKLIRGGGARDIPHLVDHGLAIGGAASAIGVDFPYPNFTGPATGMGLLLARAARAIRNEGGSFSLDDLKRHYLEPLQKTHWWSDVCHLRRWPGYVEKTRVFFDGNIDALHGSLYAWTRPDGGLFKKWTDWTRVIRRVLPPQSLFEALRDTRAMLDALGLDSLAVRRPILRLLLDGGLNSLRDLIGKKRPHVEPAGRLRWHYSVLGGRESAGPLPRLVAGWGQRLTPVANCAAREIYRNDPVPLRDKLEKIVELFSHQINLLDLFGLGLVLATAGITAGVQSVIDGIRRLLRRGAAPRDDDSLAGRWLAATRETAELTHQLSQATSYANSSLTPHPSPLTSSDSWEDKLGRLSYDSTKDSHIKLFWPRRLTDRAAVADDGVWHVCPAKVYECHKDAAGQVRLVVNHENCIKCESCWRATDLVDWARNGGHQMIYRVVSPATSRLLDAQDRAAGQRPRPPKSRDWWATMVHRIGQRAASSATNGHLVGEMGRLEQLCGKIADKLHEFDRSLADEPRTIDENRARWIESLATYAKQLVEDLANTVRDGPLAKSADAALRDVQAALAELTASLQAKMAEVARRAYDRHFFWAAADGRQIVAHHLEGLRRLLQLLRGRFAPSPLEPTASARWLAEERDDGAAAAFRAELNEQLDRAFDRLSWRELEKGTPLTKPQIETLRDIAHRVAAAGTIGSAHRKAVLTELGRRNPSLGYVVASHLWATDLLRRFGGPAGEGLIDRIHAAGQTAAFAWEGVVEIDRDDEGARLRGQKIFVPTATAAWFVVLMDNQLVVLPRETPGLRVEPLGTIGMHGAAPATLVFDNVALPAVRCRLDAKQFDRLWTVTSTVDLAAIGCGMSERLEARAIEHAASRVQFPGLFLDEDSRESIGKFGAVKKMLAQIGARRLVLETLLYQFGPGELSDDSQRRALELKIIVGVALGGYPGSITYNVTQIFGGTGYSEEDFLPKFYRDGSTLLTLGVPARAAAEQLGNTLLAATHRAATAQHAPHTTQLLPGLAESELFDEAAQRKALQRELDTLRRVRNDVESAVGRWQSTAAHDPQAAAIRDCVAETLGRRQAELAATESLLLRTHARLEHARPTEKQVELLRAWLDDVAGAARDWIDRLADPDCSLALQSIEPPPLMSKIEVSYQAMLTGPAPYVNGDYLVKPFDPAAPRYVPEMVPFDPVLGRYDRELDELLRARYRDRLFGGLSYERHVERQHKLDPEDFDLFRAHGFLKMYIARELGGLGKTKAEYNLLVKNLIKNGDVGQTLTVQANTSIGTVPVLLGLYKELPKAKKEIAEFRSRLNAYDDLAYPLSSLAGTVLHANFDYLKQECLRIEKAANRWVGPSPAVRVACADLLRAIGGLGEAVSVGDRTAAIEARVNAIDAVKRTIEPQLIDSFTEELDRRVLALTQFQQWIASGQMTVFALTEPSAGSDTARVATRAVLRSVEVHPETDGSFRFTPVSGKGDRRVIDARRLEFRADGVLYRWSDAQEPARVMFDEYDYEADDSDRPRYYMAGPVKVPFHDIAQIRPRNGKQFFDYWELNGAKMWMTNARMAGVMVLYAKTKYGVTSFCVDRHAEGLLVGKNEDKMGQKSSVTNELGLQAVRVPRENVNGVEGRGQVNALEALNAGRAGLTTSNTTSMDDVIARAERFAIARHGQLTAADRSRLEEMAEIRFMCQALAHELVGRADHRDTGLYRVEPSIGKMVTSELLMRVIELSEEIHGLEGHTTLHNLEKHKRDHRIITVYEGANDVQRSLILKDLVRDIAGRARPPAPGSVILSHAAGSERLSGQRAMLEEMKHELERVLRDSVAAFGDEIWQNPGLQSTFFRLSDAAAFIKLADSALGRAEWVMRHLDAHADAAYRDWTVRVTRRATARLRQQVRQCLSHVTESTAALRQSCYPAEIRAASLMMGAPHEAKPARPAGPHEISRPMQIVVVLEPDPTLSPRPSLADGRWREVHFRLDQSDVAALAAARAMAAAATAPVRVVAVAAGPRRATKVLEEALAAGADEAMLVMTDDRAFAPEATARALARAIQSHCHAPELVLSRALAASAAPGLAGMLVARELGLQFAPNARAVSVRFTEDHAAASVWTDGRERPQRVSLPAGIGVVAGHEPSRFRIADFLASLDRPIKVVAWPEEIDRRALRLSSATSAAARAGAHTEAPQSVSPNEAADLLLDSLGLKAAPGAQFGDDQYRAAIEPADQWNVSEPGAVLIVVACESSGRLRPGDRRAVQVASALARQHHRPLVALTHSPSDEDAERRVAADLARLGARTIVLAPAAESPAPRQAGEYFARLLAARWSPRWTEFSAIVGPAWAEPTLARFGGRLAELVCRVSDFAPGPRGIVVRGERCAGKIDAERELPVLGDRPIWITVTNGVECELPPLDEVAEPRVVRWIADVAQVPGRPELLELLGQVRDEIGVARLADADFIIDVGYGIGSSDGFEELIRPLEKLLREIGVANVVLGASRKVTEELKVLPASQQIGQTGQSVNPAILLAIGISGAPQHLNYIGSRATILGFNRDTESPIMTLNQRQPRPRVFPIVGDLFETVPAFMSALRELEHSATPQPAAEPESAIAR